MPLSSRILYLLSALQLSVGAHLADMRATHIYNPAFPPHAKFHVGQTLSFSIMLGLLTVFFAWRRSSDRRGAVLATTACASVYWTSQATAIAYPGTAFFDGAGEYLLGMPAQVVVELVVMSVIAVATWCAVRPGAQWS